MERLHQAQAYIFVHADLRCRVRHRVQPLVALLGTDRVRQVARAQARVAVACDVQVGAAHPAGQKHEQLVARIVVGDGVHGMDAGELGFQLHDVVEAVDQFTQARGAADGLVQGGSVRHAAS